MQDKGGYQPTEQDRRGIEEWFANYDALAMRADIDAMADQAAFPINVVSHGEDGEGSAARWDRERFVREMTEVVGAPGEASMESTRTPHFLSEHLAVVITDATITTDGHSFPLRYADVLIKHNGSWAFQTMIQGGWGTMT